MQFLLMQEKKNIQCSSIIQMDSQNMQDWLEEKQRVEQQMMKEKYDRYQEQNYQYVMLIVNQNSMNHLYQSYKVYVFVYQYKSSMFLSDYWILQAEYKSIDHLFLLHDKSGNSLHLHMIEQFFAFLEEVDYLSNQQLIQEL